MAKNADEECVAQKAAARKRHCGSCRYYRAQSAHHTEFGYRGPYCAADGVNVRSTEDACGGWAAR
jgi:hypothetical protein